MGALLITIVIIILTFVVINYLRAPKCPTALFLYNQGYKKRIGPPAQPDLNILNCRVRLAEKNKADDAFGTFVVEICGSIHTPDDTHNATVQITVEDLTDAPGEVKPVHSTVKKWQKQDSSEFYYSADLGKLTKRLTILSDWMTIARIDSEWLMLPREGERCLQFTVSILSRQSGWELACAEYTLAYENSAFGYIDLEENIQRTKVLAVTLAFAVSAADNKLYDCEIELIKKWARENIDVSGKCCSSKGLIGPLKLFCGSDRVRRKLEKMLKITVCYFSCGNKVDTYKICKEIVEIVPVSHRYDILELCLNVVRAKGVAAVEELSLLKDLAVCLEVDMDRFRSMTERILPPSMHEVKDREIILGVTSDMTEEQTREQLNKEYCKWNARVTCSDPEVRIQADRMLEFIAEARKQYVN